MPRNIPAGKAFVTFGVDLGPLQKGLKKVNASIRRTGQNFTALGKDAVKAGAAMAGAFTAAAIVGADFGDKIAEAGLTTKAVGEEFDALKNKAKELGRTTSFTASEAAAGLAELGRSGLDAGESISAIDTALNVSRASGGLLDIAGAAQLVVNTARSFDTQDFERVGDVLVATANNSSQNIIDLSESMKFAAKEGKAVGLTLEQTAKTIGVLANGSQRASMAGTGLRQVFNRLAKSEVQENLTKLGVRFKTLTGDVRDPIDLLKDLQKRLSGLGALEKKGILTELFDVRGASAALSIFTVAEDKANELGKTLDNARGTAKNFATVLDDTLGGSFRMLVSAIQSVAIEVTEAVQGPLRKMIDTFTAVSATVSKFVSKNPELIGAILSITAATLSLGTAFVAAGVSLTAFSALFSPFALVLAAVGVAVLALSDVFNDVFDIKNSGIVEFIEGFQIAGLSIGSWFEIGVLVANQQLLKLRNSALEAVSFIGVVFAEIPTLFEVAFYGLFDTVLSVWRQIVPKIKESILELVTLLSNIPVVGDRFDSIRDSLAESIADDKFFAEGAEGLEFEFNRAFENLANSESLKNLQRQVDKNKELEDIVAQDVKAKTLELVIKDSKLISSQDKLRGKFDEVKKTFNDVTKGTQEAIEAAKAQADEEKKKTTTGGVELAGLDIAAAASQADRVTGSFSGAAAFASNSKVAQKIQKQQLDALQGIEAAVKNPQPARA